MLHATSTVQPGNEYTAEHLRLLRVIAIEVDTWPAEVVSCEFLYEQFGHWSITLRHKGKRTRFAFDARDRIVVAARLPRLAGAFSAPSDMGEMKLPQGLTEANVGEVIGFMRKHAA